MDRGKEPRCASCPRPFLMEGNEMAWEMFNILSTQLRVGGMGGIFGVELTMFPALCDIKQIPPSEREILLDKILIIIPIAVGFWNQSANKD